MMKFNSDFAYYCLNETCVSEDVAKKHLKVLDESTITVGDKKYITLTYEQCLQSFGMPNWNTRTYDAGDTIKALDGNPLIQWDIKNNSWTSEYGHPILEKGKNELQRQMTILPEKACNTINKYWLNGNLLMGECTTLYGGWGEVLMGRILTKYPAMSSSRAVGGVDSRGRVLPGYTIVTFDTVIRPSHKEAYAVKGSEMVNDFEVPKGNTMNECVVKITPETDESFKNFVLSESSQKIEMVLDTMKLDYSSISIDNNNIRIKKINEDACTISTILIPLKKVVSREYHNLF